MAHEIEGNSAFFASNTPAWHKLGVVLKDAPSIAEAWRMAYPHNVLKLPLQAVAGDSTMAVESHSAIVRDDGKLLGVVGSGYEVVQPWDSFAFFEPFLQTGEVELEAGGSLREGTRMWALAKIKDASAVVTGKDAIKGYFLVYTSFDGSLAHGLQFTATRVVCANTLAIAQSAKSFSRGALLSKDQTAYRFKHTAKIHDRIDAARIQVDFARQKFNETVNVYKQLAESPMAPQAQREYITLTLTTEEERKDGLSTRKQNQIGEVINLLDSQRGLELVPAIRGTKWQAYNAVSEYLTHNYGRNDDSRLNAQWFGASAEINSKALELAIAA